MDQLADRMRERWQALATILNASADADALFTLIEALYSNPPRAYHNLTHIAVCLQLLDEHRGLAEDAGAVELALCLHDCIYDPRRSDNEARSAAISRVFARELSLAPARAARVESLIMATTHRAPSLKGDEALVADIDMAILGAPPDEYSAYAAAIRQEYSFVSEADYRKGRGDFLRKLLARGPLFHLAQFEARLGAGARRNIDAELQSLDS
jgi:predicted metal-dependent HD superfamily phosphohydrolase